MNCLKTFDQGEAEACNRVVLLEFPDEPQAYLDQCQRQRVEPSAAQVISLDPKVELWLNRQQVPCVSSIRYFTAASHARALRKSDLLLGWLRERIHLEDSLGVRETYANTLLWYARHFIHHLLWVSEILAEAQRQHPGAVLAAPLGNTKDNGSPWMDDRERYLGLLAEGFCHQHGNAFQPIAMRAAAPRALGPGGNHSWLAQLGNQIGAKLHRAALRRMGRRRPLLALTHSYQMDTLVRQAREELPELPWVVRGEGGGSVKGAALLRRAVRAVTAGWGKGDGRLYLGEAWLSVLERTMREEAAFAAALDRTLSALADEVDREEELFSHQGVPFGRYLAAKLRTGIRAALRELHLKVRAADDILGLLQPRLVMSPFGREFCYALGDLGRKRDIPGLLISHGSFTPMQDNLAELGWSFHSDGLFHGSYTHSALQTPLAEAFAKQLSSKAEFVRTGPLVWGRPVDRDRSTALRGRLLGGQPNCRVVVHAGSFKLRGGLHFHVYETLEEYVASTRELICAMAEAPNAFLVVRTKPSHLTVEEFRSLLPLSDRYCISVDEPFQDVLGLADLLVAFSSTTIEEALQNRIPVLLYGGGGRYQHVEALEVTPDTGLEPRAVYAVRRPEHLADALRRILASSGRPPLPEQLFRPYIYRPEEIRPFGQLLRDLAGSDALR